MWQKGTQQEMEALRMERAERERYMQQHRNQEADNAVEEIQIPVLPKEPPKAYSETQPTNTPP